MQDRLAHHLATMAYNNAWSNQRLLDALERSLAGKPVNPEARRFFDPEEPFVACPELHAAQRAVDRRLVDLCVALTGDTLDTPIAVLRRTGVEHEPATRLLAHLFQHQ